MELKVTGIVGLDFFDTLFYLSRVEHNLGSRILLLDYSPNESIATYFPRPDDFDLAEKVVSYRGIHASKIKYSMEDLKNKEYDHIYINYGLSVPTHDCDDWMVILNQQLHVGKYVCNLIKSMVDEGKDLSKNVSLIYKDSVDNEESFSNIERHLFAVTGLMPPNVYYLDCDYNNFMNRLRCDEATLTFRRISHDHKTLIKDILSKEYPSVPPKEFQLAYKKAERGDLVDRIILESGSRADTHYI